jgi:hypothetical protein
MKRHTKNIIVRNPKEVTITFVITTRARLKEGTDYVVQLPESSPPQMKTIVCEYDGCSYYPPVDGYHTCKYCGSKVPVYCMWSK